MASLAWAPASEAGPGTTLHAARRERAISVDGRLDEPAWPTARVAAASSSGTPTRGSRRPSPRSYVSSSTTTRSTSGAARDSDPGGIVRQLSRRDATAEADTFTLYLDPHRDRRTGVVLQVSAAGVQRDAAIYDDNFEDDTWDAVWESAVSVDGGAGR